MRFLYGVKQCHRCALRESCNLKNDPKTLTEQPITVEITNRGLLRHPREHGGITVKIQSFCKNFRVEEKTFSPPTTKKELTINPIEKGPPPHLLTTPFNTVRRKRNE